jgi:hypothetical protein
MNRKIFRLSGLEEEQVQWSQIKKGDLFRVEPADEEDKQNINGTAIFVAAEDAASNEGVWGVMADLHMEIRKVV